MSVPDKPLATQRPNCPVTIDGHPVTMLSDPAMVQPLSTDGTIAFDHTLSALIDHLMIIEDHQLAIEDRQMVIAWQQVTNEGHQGPLAGHLGAIAGHLGAIATTFTAVKTLVEELLP